MNFTPQEKADFAEAEERWFMPPEDNVAMLDALERDAARCPHCDDKGWLEEIHGSWHITTDCGARGPGHKDPDGAVRLWNRLADR